MQFVKLLLPVLGQPVLPLRRITDVVFRRCLAFKSTSGYCACLSTPIRTLTYQHTVY